VVVVALEGEDIIGTALDDLCGDGLLAAHGIDGDDAPVGVVPATVRDPLTAG
jgi:hypothetical protein